MPVTPPTQMRLGKATLEQLDRLRQLRPSTTRTQLVRDLIAAEFTRTFGTVAITAAPEKESRKNSRKGG